MLARTIVTAVAALWMGATSCCCCSGDWFEVPEDALPADAPQIEERARSYAQENAAAILRSVDAGAGSGDCVSGGGDLALSLGAAVLSRGHAGTSAAGSVQFDLGACARRLIVHVVKRAGAWVAVGAIVLDARNGAVLFRIGAPVVFEAASDVDVEVDEIF